MFREEIQSIQLSQWPTCPPGVDVARPHVYPVPMKRTRYSQDQPQGPVNARSGWLDSVVNRLLACGVAMLCLVPALAFGYSAERDRAGHLVTFTRRAISVFWLPQAVGDLTVTQVENTIQAAIKVWDSAANSNIELGFGGRVETAPAFDIFVRFDAQYQQGTGDPSGRVDVVHDGNGTLERVDIVLNNADYLWTLSGTSTQQGKIAADLQGALVHQLGHALGLGHSRHADAAMYFYRTDKGGRILSDDDLAGIQWLWPGDPTTPGHGGSCDACQTDADCSTGRCFAWQSGWRHCLLPCTDHQDCALGESCALVAGQKVCAPNEGNCTPEANSVGTGQVCYADSACPSGHICVTGSRYGWCGPLAQIDGGNCLCDGNVFFCEEGTCRIGGDAAIGSPCMVASQCQLSPTAPPACAPALTQGGACTVECGSNLPCPKNSGMVCNPDGFCAKPGPLAVGWPCQSGFDCASALCLDSSKANIPKACSKTCELASDCPVGTGCLSYQGGQYCLPYGDAALGGPCTGPGTCGGQMACVMGTWPGYGTCQAPCDPFAATDSCQAGSRCTWVGGPLAARGACFSLGQGVAENGACDDLTPCAAGLLCGSLDGVGHCLRPCAPEPGGSCGQQGVCTIVAEPAHGPGLCATDADKRVVIATRPKLPYDNFAAASPDLSTVVRAAAWTAPPPVSSGGCSAGATADNSAWALGICAVVLRAARRRRAY